jgi:hypothetical protein
MEERDLYIYTGRNSSPKEDQTAAMEEEGDILF